MRKRIQSVPIIACLLICLFVSAAFGSGNYSDTYEEALKMAGNDLTNRDNLNKTVTMLDTIGSYAFTKSYSQYFRQILAVLSEDPDLDQADRVLRLLSGSAEFAEDLANRGLPSCGELLKYTEGRKHEAAGEYSDAFAVYGTMTILDAIDRALELMNAESSDAEQLLSATEEKPMGTADILRLQKYLTRQETLVDPGKYDINKDGVTDILDVLCLQKQVANW